MPTMKPYVIQQGDYLTRLATRLRFDADAVWNHPANEALRALRPDPNQLCPGDLLRVPAEPVEAPLPLRGGAANRYRSRAPRVGLTVAFRDGDEGAPLANERYVIEGLGGRVTGTSDGDGRVRFEVPVTVSEVRVVFCERHLAFQVDVGHLDPVNSDSGVRQRLAHLGFDGWPLGAAAGLPRPEDDGARAVRAFQRANDLEETGVSDDATRAALRSAHGG